MLALWMEFTSTLINEDVMRKSTIAYIFLGGATILSATALYISLQKD